MLFKFRTMLDVHSANGQLLPDDERMTSVGEFLRSSSLDELPTLFNVVRGEMSLVGPRPLLMEYLLLYSERQNQRHNVRPGLTGWAQVHGRNLLSWPEKLELDVWYVENRSFRLDVKILFMTVGKVLRREGISHGGHVTMEPFKGDRL
jgi:sugar transferase EpsL